MGTLKRLVIVLALYSLATGCSKKDTAPEQNVGARTVEPRLTGVSSWTPCRTSLPPGHTVPDAECAPLKTPPTECDETATSDAEAVRLLASQRGCTDAAIAALENIARIDPAALSDLAAAYYVRAQREDRPSDLLTAYEAAEHAVAALPGSPAARFNHALIEEALGLSEDAAASWRKFFELDHSQWAVEGHEHLAALQRKATLDRATQWAHIRAQLPSASMANTARLIAPFQLTAERYLEDELLPSWAATPTPQCLMEARTLAMALAQLSGDRFTVDVVNAVERSPRTSRQGLLAFRNARNASGSLARSAAPNLNAERLLELDHNPLSLLARLGYANAVSFQPEGYAQARALVDPIEQEARKRGYRHLAARICATRANYLAHESLYPESLAQSDTAIAEYQRLGDDEGVADTRMRRVGVVGKAGQHDLEWREALQTIRDSLVDPQSRHNSLGGMADAALALGHPRVALLYTNAAFRLIRRELVAIAPEDKSRIQKMQLNLATALRSRANIELRLDEYDRAMADLDEAIRLSKKEDVDQSVRNTMAARLEEVRGQALLHLSPARAVSAFSKALELAGNEFLTFRAALLAQRAEALKGAGRNVDAEKDLRASLAQLQVEESRILNRRERGKNEDLWSPYFSRFSETYQSLIRLLLENGEEKDAFKYSERERAFEPLNLVSEIAPKDFDGKTKGLVEISEALPPGTLLIEYSFLGDRAIAWLVSREGYEIVSLKTTPRDIERLSTALQRAANARNRTDFENRSNALHDAVIAEPLAKFGAIPARLVIVPDGPLHGLPFAALKNPKTNRYLIEDTPIEIAGSSTLYLVSLARDKALASRYAPSVLLVGDPAFNGALPLAQGLKPLPHAKSECERIDAFYAPNARVLVEGDATIPRFLEGARNSTVIHVAAHTIVNAQAPSRSFILFAPSANEPGPLDSQALLTRLSLAHTRLIVLSTCSSAGGLPIGAEGVAPLVRPLIGAGVPAVVGTLWNVEDATAEELLVSFHRHYREGKDAAVALQLAQIGLLKNNNNPGLRSVLAWAPFQVIGHGSSPFAPTPPHKEKPP